MLVLVLMSKTLGGAARWRCKHRRRRGVGRRCAWLRKTAHNPEGLAFRRYAQAEGFKAAVAWRDSGKPMPEGDDARERIRALERKGRQG
jgi:hypothetical protein